MPQSKPFRVFYSPLSRRFYATNKYRLEGSNAVITGEKTDVTNDIADAIRKYAITFEPETANPAEK